MKTAYVSLGASLIVFLLSFEVLSQTPSPSPAATPPPSNIYLADLSNKSNRLLPGEPKKITDSPGYNNQPSFTPDGQSVLYTSIRNRQADIYRYDVRTGQTSQITDTPESEYSPTVMPDGRSISVVRVEADGTQRLWRFPPGNGSPSVILFNIKPVGYHCWIDDHTLALFILGSRGKANTLQIVDTRTEKAETIVDNPGRILRLIPRQHKLSFVQKLSEHEWLIKAFDLKSKNIVTLIKTLDGVEDYAWTPGGILLMAKDAKLYKWDPARDKDWSEVADYSRAGLKRITRLMVSPNGNLIAFVAI